MKFGAHLPLIDFDGNGWQANDLNSYTDVARELGFDALSANDHFVFQRPWLDCIVALASVVGRSGDMTLATTVALPVLRHPVALAKHAAALDILSGGRLVLGVGPGSSARDYALVGMDFEERWKRLDAAVRVLRRQLKHAQLPYDGPYYPEGEALEPPPMHDVPIWIGSWGSDAGLRRVARLADGWLASAYNTTPGEVRTARANLARQLSALGRDADDFPCSLATMWTYVTEDGAKRAEMLASLGKMLNRQPTALSEQVLIGSAEECAARLRDYADAGVGLVFLWPLADERDQLQRFMRDVAPGVTA